MDALGLIPWSRRFVVLLGALTLMMVVTPALRYVWPHSQPLSARVVLASLFGLILLTAVFAVSRGRWTNTTALVLAVPVLVLEALGVPIETAGISVAKNVAMMAFLGFVIVVVLRYLFETDRVTLDTIAASACVYLMLAVFWAELYAIIDVTIPHSFAWNTAPAAGTPATGILGESIFEALYFSLVTMTTLGYGDVVPRTAPAQALATTQAVVGQLYLTVLVARLVGLHIVVAAEKSGRQ